MIRREIGILGGGISAIALASRLGEDVEILEKSSRTGGLCATIVEDGFTFDAAGPHIMFSKNKDVLNLMISILGDNVHQNRRENRIWYAGRLVKYPFENDLASLPKEDTFDCLHGYIENPRANDTPANLAEWSYKTFGAGISEKYFIPYNEKIWNYDARKIGLEFVERIPKPPVADVIKSAIGIPTEGYLHQLYYSYPTRGGFEAIVHGFEKQVRGDIRTNWPVASVEKDGDGWRVVSSTGEERRYRILVNTIPIHELLKIWKDAPDDARQWASKLRYNSLVNVLLGSSTDPGHNYTALYVPDPQILFHRLSFPKAFGSECVPPGHSSIMAEITTNAGEDGVWETDDATLTERIIADIARIGFVDPKTIVYKRVSRFLYGYPVYDLEYRKNVTAMREAVARTGLRLLGRFAQFDYITSDVCVERALKMAEELRAPEAAS
ncbi:MAG TPA: FAD-dependent oxidoreductase [Thermoanaerobaculia bacterium]|nr:FAD-dependent oxidoreductase [Thermoanaerobaculia bacterium]